MSACALSCCFVVMNSLGVVSIGLVAVDSTTAGSAGRGCSPFVYVHVGILPTAPSGAKPNNFR